MTSLVIEVKAKHIKTGECQNAKKCMIAAAINDTYDLDYVAVRANGITVTQKNEDGTKLQQHWALPLRAARALVRFDTGEKVNPFKFSAKLIDEKVIPAMTEAQRDRYRRHSIDARAAARAEGTTLEKKYPQTYRPRTGGV